MKTILYVFHCSTIGGGSYCLLNVLKNLDRSQYKPAVLLATQGALVEEINKLVSENLYNYIRENKLNILGEEKHNC